MPPSPGSFITQREKLRDHFKKHLSQDDRYDLLGKSVACRIKALANRQRLIVEKRINDILFEADMGMLNTPTDFNNFGSSSSTSNPSPSANATLYDLNSHQTKVSDLRTQEEPTHTLAIYFREFSDGSQGDSTQSQKITREELFLVLKNEGSFKMSLSDCNKRVLSYVLEKINVDSCPSRLETSLIKNI
nr:unnamed protein product [Callosobruchus analis]